MARIAAVHQRDTAVRHRLGALEERFDHDVVRIGRTHEHGCESKQLVGMNTPKFLDRSNVGGVVDLEHSSMRRHRQPPRVTPPVEQHRVQQVEIDSETLKESTPVLCAAEPPDGLVACLG